MTVDRARVERLVGELLEAIGEDPEREGLQATPRRVAAMYEELFAGVDDDPESYLTVTFAAEHDEMVMVRDIPFASLCEHHMVPVHRQGARGLHPRRRRPGDGPVQAGPPGRRATPGACRSRSA